MRKNDAFNELSVRFEGIVPKMWYFSAINRETMETKKKQHYEAPEALMVELIQHGVLCASGDTEAFHGSGNNYNDSDFE